MDIENILRILKNGAEKPKDDLNNYTKGKLDGQVQAYSHAWTLVKNLSLSAVGSSNNIDYEKAFELAMNYIRTTVVSMEQSDENEENWIKLKDFIKKHKIK